MCIHWDEHSFHQNLQDAFAAKSLTRIDQPEFIPVIQQIKGNVIPTGSQNAMYIGMYYTTKTVAKSW